jgi:hypothetical protein
MAFSDILEVTYPVMSDFKILYTDEMLALQSNSLKTDLKDFLGVSRMMSLTSAIFSSHRPDFG